jgi:hypothetical protein
MKTHLLRSAFLCCSLAIFPAWPFVTQSAMSQENCGGIDGRVTSIEGWVIPGATIRILNKKTKQRFSVETTESGEYSVCLATGMYDVFANALAYKSMKRESIEVSEPAKVFIDFVMEHDKSFRVDPDHP